MSRIPQITIGADYFRTTVRKESAYPLAWRWIKEVLQNSYDAGATEFNVIVDKKTRSVTASDNAGGMDMDTLLDVFLSFGGSKKDRINNPNTVGGFGDAKKVICFCWDKWSIITQDNLLTNELLGKEVKKVEYYDGTIIEVCMGDELKTGCIIDYLSLCQLDIKIKFTIVDEDGSVEDIKIPKLHKRKLTRELDFGDLYVNKSNPSGKLVVRMNGLALYTEYLWDVEATCVLELHGMIDPKSNDYLLNVTRERLTWKYNDIVTDIIREIVSDPVKALEEKPKNEISIIEGVGNVPRLRYYNTDLKFIKIDTDLLRKSIEGEESDELISKLEMLSQRNYNLQVETKYNSLDEIIEKVGAKTLIEHLCDGIKVSDDVNISAEAIPTLFRKINDSEVNNDLHKIYPYDIIIKGNTDLKYDSLKYQRILLSWHKMIQYVVYYNDINNVEIFNDSFTIGFTFNEEALAEHIVTSDNRTLFLINPSDLSFSDYGWKGMVMEILDRACHEIAHCKYISHDTSFVAYYHKLKRTCNWYIDEILRSIGNILRCSSESLVYTANLSESFELPI